MNRWIEENRSVGEILPHWSLATKSSKVSIFVGAEEKSLPEADIQVSFRSVGQMGRLQSQLHASMSRAKKLQVLIPLLAAAGFVGLPAGLCIGLGFALQAWEFLPLLSQKSKKSIQIELESQVSS